MKHEILDSPGKIAYLLGNEAIARGALEAGVNFASGYPGTPSTEVLETLINVASRVGIKAEWAVNEKVAYESGLAASLSGLRALVTMKHVGLNVAADSFVSSAYTGVIGGFVVVVADDPSMHSSQNEQDTRFYGQLARIPIIEPSNAQECKDFVKVAFDISEKVELPVVLRTTTRVSHSRGVVALGEIIKTNRKPLFNKNPGRFQLLPSIAKKNRILLLERFNKLSNLIEEIRLEKRIGNGSRLGIITAGAAYPNVIEAVDTLDLWDMVSILKLTFTYPLPKKVITDFIRSVDEILIVEELDPVIESGVKNIMIDNNVVKRIHGKDLIPEFYELSPRHVIIALSNLTGIKVPKDYSFYDNIDNEVGRFLPPRPPAFCAGCPHRSTLYSLQRALAIMRVRYIYSNDIGCYSLSVNPPFGFGDVLYSMGAGVGVGQGLALLQDQFVVAAVGDSTFYHAAIPALINAVHNHAPLLVLVMDNGVTAMTGQQSHPGTGVLLGTGGIPIENIAKSLGVEYVKVINSFNIKDGVNIIRDAIKYVLENKRPAVVISRGLCALEEINLHRIRGEKMKLYIVDNLKCTGCKVCTDYFTCPAISFLDNKAFIDPLLCTGCGSCAQICPYKAIIEVQ
ncbi:MAG: indolepyruvate ferredoxin oxidoreductase subunit alpha [Thermoprotei archaeon]